MRIMTLTFNKPAQLQHLLHSLPPAREWSMPPLCYIMEYFALSPTTLWVEVWDGDGEEHRYEVAQVLISHACATPAVNFLIIEREVCHDPSAEATR